MVDDATIQAHFSKQLTMFRKKAEFSKAKLAKMASLSQSSITQYEQGKKAPSIINIRRLAEALGITVNDLCGTDEEEEWNRKPVTALLTALTLFEFRIVDIGTNTISLQFKEDCAGYSATEIKRFFEKYRAIQEIETLDIADNKLKGDMIETLVESLAQEFEHLPDFPKYHLIERKKEPEKTAAET